MSPSADGSGWRGSDLPVNVAARKLRRSPNNLSFPVLLGESS